MSFAPPTQAVVDSQHRLCLRRSRILLVILMVAFVGRVGFALTRGLNSPPEPTSDQEEYDAYAWNLAQGNGYRGPSPDVADRNHLTAYRPPMPSMVMAGVYVVVGHRFDAVRLLFCVFATCSVWLTYRLGRRAYGDGVGLLAAAGYAIYPLAIFQSSDLLSEPLGVMLFLAFLELTLAYAANGSWRNATLAGLIFGLALLARANFVLVIPLFAIWALFQFRHQRTRLLQSALVLLVAAVVMIPWVVRNYMVFGKLIPFSTMGGSVLLQGNNRIVVTVPKAFGYSVWDTELDEYRDDLRAAGDEVERDRRAKEFAIRWLKDHPDRWGFLIWQKFVRSWTPFLEHNPSRSVRVIYLLTWGPVFILFVFALAPTFISALRQGSPIWLLHVSVLQYVLNSVIFFANIRYRSPIEPVCFILAAWSVRFICARWQTPVTISPGSDAALSSRPGDEVVASEHRIAQTSV